MNRHIYTGLAALLLVLLPLVARAGEICVQGSGSVSGQMDLCRLSAGIRETAPGASIARARAEEVTRKVTGALLLAGVKEENLKTESYYLGPVMDYSAEVPVVSGYEVRHALEIRLEDLTQLDRVLELLSAEGAAEISSLSFECSRAGELYGQALELAVAQAREKAGTLAAASGLTLGEVREIRELQGDAYAEGLALRADKAAGASGIRPGEGDITARVSVTFETGGM